MSTERDGEYEIGYRKPPANTRFQKGRSGNPKGRPKESKDLTTLIEKELDARVVVNENGRNERIPKRNALVKRVINSALKGDHRFAQMVLQNQGREDGVTRVSRPSTSNCDPPFRASDEELDGMLARLSSREQDAIFYFLAKARAVQLPYSEYLSEEMKMWFKEQTEDQV